jgi:transaldolase
LAWQLTDQLVLHAQSAFKPSWETCKGNNGYVSFELEPLLEDPARNMPVAERTKTYIELGTKWAAGHRNRMIKVPATEGGLAALESLASVGVTINVTLIFSERQYKIARDSVWRGRQKFGQLDRFKSVYSIFVSRLDVYTEKHCADLSPAAQGLVGIVNAKRLWHLNQIFWADKKLPLHQEIPCGTTINYLELARRAGDPKATRAAGHANGRNPISIVVPCHRLVGSDGSMTGYGGGVERKKWLLAHEGAAIR